MVESIAGTMDIRKKKQPRPDGHVNKNYHPKSPVMAGRASGRLKLKGGRYDATLTERPNCGKSRLPKSRWMFLLGFEDIMETGNGKT